MLYSLYALPIYRNVLFYFNGKCKKSQGLLENHLTISVGLQYRLDKERSKRLHSHPKFFFPSLSDMFDKLSANTFP